MKRLTQILSLKRGHDSEGEQIFIDTVLADYDTTCYTDSKDQPLAYVLTTDPTSKTLFSCHIDTVHPAGATPHNPAIYDEDTALFYKMDGTPLGADDGAGVWLLLEMIDAGIAGTYIFHRGEERGGIGSSAMAAHHSEFLQQFDRAVAFDRRGTTSVITHQAGGRCCSDAFAKALAAQLGGAFQPDSSGIYTDTAEYTGHIPECTNISCGYDREHSGAETLDVEFLFLLRGAVLVTGWESLPVVRKVTDPGYEPYDYDWGSNSWATTARVYSSSPVEEPKDQYDLVDMKYRDLLAWIRKADSMDVADLLLTLADQLVYEEEQAAEEDTYRRQELLRVGMV